MKYGADDWDWTAISGFTNKQQIQRFNPNLAINQDVPHFVAGTEWKQYGLFDGMVSVGAHTVFSAFGDNLEGSRLLRLEEGFDSSITGLDVEISGLWDIDWYFEGDLFRRSSLGIACAGSEKGSGG